MNNETTASQPKSIGDDPQQALVRAARKMLHRIDATGNKSVGFTYSDPLIDGIRAALVAIERAPAAQASAEVVRNNVPGSPHNVCRTTEHNLCKRIAELEAQASATIQAAPDVTRRKAFICTGCEGVYPDEPTTSCDCMVTPQRFVEGEIVYPIAAAIQEPVMVAEPVGAPDQATSFARPIGPLEWREFAGSVYAAMRIGHLERRLETQSNCK